ncbi:hypothetical protein RQN30_00155 [Arcanobacterium hippocoleae]
MLTAPRAEQLRLLDIAELDSQIARIKAQIRNHSLKNEIAVLNTELNTLKQQLAAAAEAKLNAEDAARSLAAQNSDLAVKVAAKESQLRTGTGMDSRQLLALQQEIDSARAKINQISDAEFSHLEQIETHTSEIESLNSEIAGNNAKLAQTQSQLEIELADFTVQLHELNHKRESEFSTISESLAKVYETARISGGLAVIGVQRNGDSTGGVEISPTELASLKSADPDSVYISDDYDCVVVLLES